MLLFGREGLMSGHVRVSAADGTTHRHHLCLAGLQFFDDAAEVLYDDLNIDGTLHVGRVAIFTSDRRILGPCDFVGLQSCEAYVWLAQWAFVGDKAGSYLDLKLDTRTSISRDGAPHAPVVLTHWRGPTGMGQAGALMGNLPWTA